MSLQEAGELIRAVRIRRGWTQKQLADRCDLSVSHISKVEVGREHPSESATERICEALELSPTEMMFRMRRVPTWVLDILEEHASETTTILAALACRQWRL